MSSHSASFDLFGAPVNLSDPGNAGTITVDRTPCVCEIVSTAAQTRTLARPEYVGAELTITMITDGGDVTVTVTGGYNENGDTTFVLSDVGQFYKFVALQTSAGVKFWRLVAFHGSGNVTSLSESVITTNVITADETGKTFYLNLVGGFTSTLPAPALGLWFRFIVKTAPTTAYIITTNGGSDSMYGMMLERAGGAGVAGAARDTFNFVASQAIIGDWVEFYSDGTNWYYHGMVDVAAGNTVAAT